MALVFDLVHLTGALSNLALLEKVRKLNGLKTELLTKPRKQRAAPKKLRLRQGEIQMAVLEVLASHKRGLRSKEIYLLVETRLGRKISSDTVYSYLSVASRDMKSGVRKVGYGRYVYRNPLNLYDLRRYSKQ